jgi:hypothetical protein
VVDERKVGQLVAVVEVRDPGEVSRPKYCCTPSFCPASSRIEPDDRNACGERRLHATGHGVGKVTAIPTAASALTRRDCLVGDGRAYRSRERAGL